VGVNQTRTFETVEKSAQRAQFPLPDFSQQQSGDGDERSVVTPSFATSNNRSL
jgi:hypothetical protein